MNLAAPRPAAPPASAVAPAGADAPFVTDADTTSVQPVDEDDVVSIPAAPPSVLGAPPHPRPGASNVPLFKTLAFRRTVIPVLLTSAALMLAVAAMRFLVHPDSVLALLPRWVPLALVAAAVALLLVAAVNMAQVREQLRGAHGHDSVSPR